MRFLRTLGRETETVSAEARAGASPPTARSPSHYAQFHRLAAQLESD